MKKILLALIITACADALTGDAPGIAWDMASGRYTCYTGEALTLVPTVTGKPTEWLWTIDGEVVATTDSYTFVPAAAGTYYITLTVANAYGSTTDEVKVTVTDNDTAVDYDIPEGDTTLEASLPWTEINMAVGRSLSICGVTFTATEEGTHTLAVGDQTVTINVCPPAGTYMRGTEGDSLVSRVYEYQPAPGHQVNGYIIVGQGFPDDCTHQAACDTVLSKWRQSYMVSLGAQGGYVVAGFDHSVPATEAGGELLIKGNPYSYQSEPGIVWVSQDDNGDGLPNDQWFELAGSEYGTANHLTDYAITYYKPTAAKCYVRWRDTDGVRDSVPYMSYWCPMDYYWQPWQTEQTLTFHGSRLVSHHTYVSGVSTIPAYDWGYADNGGSDYYDGCAHLSIANARTHDGQPAQLQYIDFVKVQTGQYGSTPNLGEISTEVHYIRCSR